MPHTKTKIDAFEAPVKGYQLRISQALIDALEAEAKDADQPTGNRMAAVILQRYFNEE